MVDQINIWSLLSSEVYYEVFTCFRSKITLTRHVNVKAYKKRRGKTRPLEPSSKWLGAQLYIAVWHKYLVTRLIVNWCISITLALDLEKSQRSFWLFTIFLTHMWHRFYGFNRTQYIWGRVNIHMWNPIKLQ